MPTNVNHVFQSKRKGPILQLILSPSTEICNANIFHLGITYLEVYCFVPLPENNVTCLL